MAAGDGSWIADVRHLCYAVLNAVTLADAAKEPSAKRKRQTKDAKDDQLIAYRRILNNVVDACLNLSLATAKGGLPGIDWQSGPKIDRVKEWSKLRWLLFDSVDGCIGPDIDSDSAVDIANKLMSQMGTSAGKSTSGSVVEPCLQDNVLVSLRYFCSENFPIKFGFANCHPVFQRWLMMFNGRDLLAQHFASGPALAEFICTELFFNGVNDAACCDAASDNELTDDAMSQQMAGVTPGSSDAVVAVSDDSAPDDTSPQRLWDLWQRAAFFAFDNPDTSSWSTELKLTFPESTTLKLFFQARASYTIHIANQLAMLTNTMDTHGAAISIATNHIDKLRLVDATVRSKSQWCELWSSVLSVTTKDDIDAILGDHVARSRDAMSSLARSNSGVVFPVDTPGAKTGPPTPVGQRDATDVKSVDGLSAEEVSYLTITEVDQTACPTFRSLFTYTSNVDVNHICGGFHADTMFLHVLKSNLETALMQRMYFDAGHLSDLFTDVLQSELIKVDHLGYQKYKFKRGGDGEVEAHYTSQLELEPDRVLCRFAGDICFGQPKGSSIQIGRLNDCGLDIHLCGNAHDTIDKALPLPCWTILKQQGSKAIKDTDMYHANCMLNFVEITVKISDRADVLIVDSTPTSEFDAPPIGLPANGLPPALNPLLEKLLKEGVKKSFQPQVEKFLDELSSSSAVVALPHHAASDTRTWTTLTLFVPELVTTAVMACTMPWLPIRKNAVLTCPTWRTDVTRHYVNQLWQEPKSDVTLVNKAQKGKKGKHDAKPEKPERHEKDKVEDLSVTVYGPIASLKRIRTALGVTNTSTPSDDPTCKKLKISCLLH